MRAGILRYTLTPLTSITIKDIYGSGVQTWITGTTIRTNIIYKSGDKLIQDFEMFNTRTVDFVVRYNKNINELMRFIFDNKTYKILFINRNLLDNSMTITTELINE